MRSVILAGDPALLIKRYLLLVLSLWLPNLISLVRYDPSTTRLDQMVLILVHPVERCKTSIRPDFAYQLITPSGTNPTASEIDKSSMV